MTHKGAAVLAVAALMALAFFLPEWLSALDDRQLLDSPSIQVLAGEQEGFAESIQLSVAEKVLLLRSGGLTVMELGREVVEGVYVNVPEPSVSDDAAISYPEVRGAYTVLVSGNDADVELIASDGTDAGDYAEDDSRLWEARLSAVQLEIRNLQAIGGLPELWSADAELSYTGYGELLYMDPDTKMSFQVYRVNLSGDSISMELLVDVQTGRFLSFRLRWTRDGAPGWGIRGAANFGGVWRNYWGLDSVSSGWYSEYNRSILESNEETVRNSGDYNAHGQINFTYDGQSFPIPLECEAFSGRSFSISWNC